MTMLERRIQEYLPLDSQEQAFLYLYEHGIAPEQVNLSAPEIRRFFTDDEGKALPFGRGWDGFKGIVNSMKENDSLSEQMFFRPGQNIAINKHPRYMPAIPHSHDFVEIQFILCGSLTQTIGDISVMLNAGDLCFIAPLSTHSPWVTSKDTVMVNLLVRTGTLRTTFANSLMERDNISEFFLRVLSGQTYQPILLCRTGMDEKVFHLIMDMLMEQDNTDPYTDKLMRAMMEHLFVLLLRDHQDAFDLGKNLRKHDETILTILRYIQSHYADVTLSELTQQFNYTETYLSHVIAEYTGQSFSQMVINMKMRNVAQRLAAGDGSITEIMRSVGYTDKTYFYRLFHRHFGTTPAKYRAEHAE